MNNSKIKEKLKKLLFEHEITPTELARRVDIPQQTIQRIVKGKIKKPHLKTLQIIAEYFELTVDEFTKDSNDEILFTDGNELQSESRSINVYEWEDLQKIVDKNTADLKSKQKLIVMPSYHSDTFGVIMLDSSMAPYFPKESILIIEPGKQSEDRSFVLVQLKNTEKFLFRQLLSDGENYFLKALSTDLSAFPIRKLDSEDKIIGKLVETRQLHFKALEI